MNRFQVSVSNPTCAPTPWRFQNSALFARLDSFLERCHDILDLTQTVLQFNKLERVEVGGRALHSSTIQLNLSHFWSLKPQQASTSQLNLRRSLSVEATTTSNTKCSRQARK